MILARISDVAATIYMLIIAYDPDIICRYPLKPCTQPPVLAINNFYDQDYKNNLHCTDINKKLKGHLQNGGYLATNSGIMTS